MRIHLFDQADSGIDLARLQLLTECAFPFCQEQPGPEKNLLLCIKEIEISLVDDPSIARVHVDFMDVPGATDVITFHHGEIIISVDTAARQAEENGMTLADEILLYVIHGLLHLAGHEDKTPEHAANMARLQQQVLRDVCA